MKPSWRRVSIPEWLIDLDGMLDTLKNSISISSRLGQSCDLAHRVLPGTSVMGRQGVPILGEDVYARDGFDRMRESCIKQPAEA